MTLTAIPAADWVFLGWSGGASGRKNPLVLTISADTSVTTALYPLVSRDVPAAICLLSGTPHASEVGKVRFAGVDHPCTVAPFETLSDTATQLALLLDAVDGFIAGSEGATFAVIGPPGEPISLDLSVASAGSAAIDDTPALTKLIKLGGSPVNGDLWTIEIDSTPYGYTVMPGDPLSEAALVLTSQIDGAGGYLACSLGSTIVVTRILGGTFALTATAPPMCSALVDGTTATTKTVVLAGPVYAGETWSVQLAIASGSHLATPATRRSRSPSPSRHRSSPRRDSASEPKARGSWSRSRLVVASISRQL